MQSAHITTLLLSINQANACYLFCLLACCPQTACARSPAIILTAVNVCYFVFFLSFSFLSLSFLFFPFLFFSSFSDLYGIGFGLPVAPASNAFCFLLLASFPPVRFLNLSFYPNSQTFCCEEKGKERITLYLVAESPLGILAVSSRLTSPPVHTPLRPSVVSI